MTDDVTKYNLDKQEEKGTKYIEPKLHYAVPTRKEKVAMIITKCMYPMEKKKLKSSPKWRAHNTLQTSDYRFRRNCTFECKISGSPRSED